MSKEPPTFRTKHRKPQRPSKGQMGFDGAWSGEERFLRACLALYVGYEETRNPVLDSAAAAPLVDRFGRTRGSSAEMHNIAEGAVWFTRATMEDAWFEVFKQVANVDRDPAHYDGVGFDTASGKDKRERTKGRRSHPMDATVAKLIKKGWLIKGGRDRFMVSAERCMRMEYHHAWDIHLARKLRWEEQTAGTFKAPSTSGWSNVFNALAGTVVFDRNMVVELAEQEPAITDLRSSEVSRRLTKFIAERKITKIAPSLYTNEAWWSADMEVPKNEHQHMLSDWLYEYLRQRATYQMRTGGADPFTVKGLMDAVHNYPDEWRDKHLPDDLLAKSVQQRLTLACHPGAAPADEALVTRVGMGQYNVADRVMKLFRPDRFLRIEDKAEQWLRIVCQHGSPRDPFWFTRIDVEIALPDHAVDSQAMISYLADRKMIRYRQDLDYIGFMKKKINFRPTPVYIPTEEALAYYNQPCEFVSEDYSIPTSETGLLIRIDPWWAEKPEFQEWMEPYRQLYAFKDDLDEATS